MNKYSDMFRPGTSGHFAQTSSQFGRTHLSLGGIAPVHSPSQSTYTFEFLSTTPSTRDQALSRENLSVGQKSQSLLRLTSHQHGLGSSSVLPQTRDISRLLYSLDAVTSKRAVASARQMLQEAVPTRLKLDKEATQYFCIATKGRSVPLTVKIDKRKGSSRCYLSKTISEPSAVLADFTFKQSSFTITDTGLVFKFPQIYLGVRAMSQFEGTLHIQFGASQTTVSTARLTKNSYATPDTPQKTLARSARSEKNFIKLNLDPVPLNSASRHTFHAKKAQEWLTRRKLVVEKKQQTLQQKKERTLAWLNKQELNRLQEKKLREECLQLQLTQKRQRKWLCLVYLAQALTQMKKSTSAGRSSTLSRLRRSHSIRRIQTAYKTLSPSKYVFQISLTRASRLLLCYNRTCVDLLSLPTEKKLIAFARDSMFYTALDNKIERLTRCVIRIQYAWRLAMKKTKEQLFLLGMMWNEVAEKISNQAKKKKKLKLSQTVLAISLQEKNKSLVNYLISRKRKFQRIVQMCMTEAMLKRAQVVSVLLKENSQALVREALPQFKYMPTEDKMKKLILSSFINN